MLWRLLTISVVEDQRSAITGVSGGVTHCLHCALPCCGAAEVQGRADGSQTDCGQPGNFSHVPGEVPRSPPESGRRAINYRALGCSQAPRKLHLAYHSLSSRMKPRLPFRQNLNGICYKNWLKYHCLTFCYDSKTDCDHWREKRAVFQPAQNDDEDDDRTLSNIYGNQINFSASNMPTL